MQVKCVITFRNLFTPPAWIRVMPQVNLSKAQPELAGEYVYLAERQHFVLDLLEDALRFSDKSQSG